MRVTVIKNPKIMTPLKRKFIDYLITSDEIFPFALTLLIVPIEAFRLHLIGHRNPKHPILFHLREASIQRRSDRKQLLRLRYTPRRKPIPASALTPIRFGRRSRIARRRSQ